MMPGMDNMTIIVPTPTSALCMLSMEERHLDARDTPPSQDRIQEDHAQGNLQRREPDCSSCKAAYLRRNKHCVHTY